MTFDDGDIPGWARPLTRGPIYVDEQTDADELSRDLGERLEALLQLYGFDASPEGWRSLALRLALDHEIAPGHPAMQVVVRPVDRPDQVGGIEPGKKWFLAMRLSKRSRKIGSKKVAAKEERKRTPRDVSLGGLQNLITAFDARRLAKPREIRRWPWEDWIGALLHTAADRLEAGHDSKRLLS